ncbi:MAG: hypothetical protein ACOY3P_12730, partial [Planctomycetota bacterium]
MLPSNFFYRVLASMLFVALFGGLPVSHAATPEFVGVLALAVEDPVAEALGLSPEQRDRLLDVIDARELAALDLALALKDLPAAEREAKLAPFRNESEAQGLAVLSAEQRAKLESLRRFPAADGPSGGILAQALSLSPDQRQQISSILDSRAVEMASSDASVAASARGEVGSRIASVLTPRQRSLWQVIAPAPATPANGEAQPAEGQGNVSAASGQAGSVAPKSDDGVEAKTAAAASGDQTPGAASAPASSSTSPPARADGGVPPELVQLAAEEGLPPVTASASKTSDGQPKPSGPAAGGVESPSEPRLRFNFQFAPWKDVLNWFARQADLSLVTEFYPQGTFNYVDDKEYTPAEAIDVLNSVLLIKGYTLLRRDRALLLINLEDKIPDSLVSDVSPEDLDKRGEYELTRTIFQLDRMTPEEAEAEIKSLLGPQGSVKVLPKSRQIQVTETAGRLRA